MKRLLTLLVLGLIIVAGSAGSAWAVPGLVAHFEFEGDFLDSSGHALDGVAHGNSTFVADGVDRGWVAGLFGQALSLCDADGIGDYVRVADDDLLDVTSLTLMAWVNVTRFGPEGMGWQGLASKPGAYEFWETGLTGQVVFSVAAGPYIAWSPTNIKTDLWHHIAGTYDETTGVMNFFVDGMLDTTIGGAAGPIRASTWDLTIGNPWGTIALIDEVRIYNRALTLEEIQAVSKIPEPATMLLLGIGLSGLALLGKKKKSWPVSWSIVEYKISRTKR